MTLLGINELADELHLASVDYRNSRARLQCAGVYRISELPEPAPAELAALDRLRDIGRRAYLLGGDDLMVNVFDTAVERYGYPGVSGTSSAWDGVGAWIA